MPNWPGDCRSPAAGPGHVVDRDRLKAVFAAIADGPPDRRAALVDEHCGGDQELRQEVEALLHAEEAAHGFLEIPALGRGIGDLVDRVLHDAATPADEVVPLGPVGRYTLLRKLGEGGMGAVYEALQDTPHRRVALKLIRGAATTPELSARLRREAEALGRLDHPSIARIFEAGSTAVKMSDGSMPTLPFLVMERIEGTNLLRHAEERRLSLRSRLELLVQIADAAQHAHRQGVIHRDLKPANILVTADGVPKVLDFGVARLVDLEPTASLAMTQAGAIVGTLAYMSPEQIQAGTVDTRSDVYSLGVIAYELLSGRPPLDVGSSSLAMAARIVVETPPRSLGSVARGCRGDIATIVDKAIAKDPDRRYATAAEFASDLRRHLSNEPIHARPPSLLYSARRFAARHKMFVGAIATVSLVLIAATTISTQHAIAAKREATRATAVAGFLRSMLEGVKPGIARTMDTKLLKHILQRTVERLDAGELGEQPEVEAELRVVVATTYEQLAQFPESIAMFERAITLYERALGPFAFKTLETRNGLIGPLLALGDSARAEHVLVELQRDVNAYGTSTSEGDYLAISIAERLGMLLANLRRHGEAIAPLQQALAGWIRRFGEKSGPAVAARNGLAGCYAETGQLDLAIASYERALELTRENVGVDHPNCAVIENNLAGALQDAGRSDEAITHIEHAIAVQRASLPPDHPALAMSLRTLANLVRISDPVRAEAALREAVGSYAKRLGPEHDLSREAREDLSGWLATRGDFAAALAIETDAHDALVARNASPAARRTIAARCVWLCERWSAASPSPEQATRLAEWQRRAAE